MQRRCDACGKAYEAKLVTSRFCGVNCRTRAHKQGIPAKVNALGPVEAAESVYAVTREILGDADRLRSAAGVKALLLARQLDTPGHTGPSMAALSKEHTSLLAQALEGVSTAADPLDELEKRRVAKLAAG